LETCTIRPVSGKLSPAPVTVVTDRAATALRTRSGGRCARAVAVAIGMTP
jgi:hypothetical protein